MFGVFPAGGTSLSAHQITHRGVRALEYCFSMSFPSPLLLHTWQERVRADIDLWHIVNVSSSIPFAEQRELWKNFIPALFCFFFFFSSPVCTELANIQVWNNIWNTLLKTQEIFSGLLQIILGVCISRQAWCCCGFYFLCFPKWGLDVEKGAGNVQNLSRMSQESPPAPPRGCISEILSQKFQSVLTTFFPSVEHKFRDSFKISRAVFWEGWDVNLELDRFRMFPPSASFQDGKIDPLGKKNK